MSINPRASGPINMPTIRNTATSGIFIFCAIKPVIVPIARMNPTEINVCFAISTETDASNFCLPGGQNAWCRLPFPGRRAADHAAMMLPKLPRIGKAALRLPQTAGLARPPRQSRPIRPRRDVAEQHRHIGQDVSSRSPSCAGAAGTRKARAVEINNSNLVLRGQLANRKKPAPVPAG
jgi:hypothetical protein